MQAARQFIEGADGRSSTADDTDAPFGRGADYGNNHDKADSAAETSVVAGFAADGANLTRASARESDLGASGGAAGFGDAALGLLEMAGRHPDDSAGGAAPITPQHREGAGFGVLPQGQPAEGRDYATALAEFTLRWQQSHPDVAFGGGFTTPTRDSTMTVGRTEGGGRPETMTGQPSPGQAPHQDLMAAQLGGGFPPQGY